MPNPTIGEIIQNIFGNDNILDMLEDNEWYVDIKTVNEEEFSILKRRDKIFKIHQWDTPHLLMQSVTYDGKVVYLTRGAHGNGLFEHPEIYNAGQWEEEIRKLYQPFQQK